MKRKITDNWGLKLASVLFSFFLWIFVTNMNDPVIQYKVSNVPVSFINTEVVTAKGKTFEVLNDTDKIDTVTITAPRSIIDSLSESNIVAVADFSELPAELSGDGNYLNIQLSTNKYFSSLESIRGSIDSVQLNIEDLKSKTLALTTKTTGTVNDGYLMGEVTPAQNQIRVNGPASLIDEITKAEVEVSVSGFSQDIVTDAEVKLLNADGEEIRSSMVKTNISSVKVNVEILQTKMVDLRFSLMGTPADGYAATGLITAEPSSILVAGKSSILNSLETVTVDAEELNITGQAGDALMLVNVKDYLPSGVELADSSFNGNVSVTVDIERTIDRHILLHTEDIVWENVPEGYTVELVDPEETYNIILNGLAERINKVAIEDITSKANLMDILNQEDTVGSLYHVTLSFETSAGKLSVSSPVQVWFKLNESVENTAEETE